MQHPTHKLTLVYYLLLLLAVATAMAGYYATITRGWRITDPTAATAIYSTMLVYVLASIPLSFGLFSTKLKKIRLIDDTDTKYSQYTRYAAIRLVLICLGLTLSIFFYYALRETSLFWLAGIEAIAAIICKPTARRINNDLDLTIED